MKVAQEPIQDTKKDFLYLVAVSAFNLDLDEFGLEVVAILE